MKNFSPKIFLLSIFVSCFSLVYSQNRIITGKVTAKEDGMALPGVSIRVKGSNIGTQTGPNGSYSINVSGNNAVLVFSYIGYARQEVLVGLKSVIDIALLPDANQLGEVVVTALGVTRQRNELPYAAQQVGAEEVTRGRSNNFVNALSGKVSGVDIKQNNSIGGSTNIVIRGYKSLTGNNQALFVVDGVPVSNANNNVQATSANADIVDQATGRGGYDYGNAAADINPDDIESINVLKGAAATALYGSRAANGVVMITTKKGKNNSFRATINSGVTFGKIDKSTFAKYQKEYGAGYGQTIYDSPDGGFLYFDVAGNGPELVVPTTEDGSYGARFDPNLLVYHWDAFDPASPYYHQKRPWVAAENDPSAFYKGSVASNQNITIEGGGEKATYKFGYTRNDETGVLPNSKINKNVYNFSGSYELVKNLTASYSANYSKVNGLGRYGTGYDTRNVNMTFRQWWETNVDIKELKEAYERNGQNVTWNPADPSDEVNGLIPIFHDNPYWSRYNNYETDLRDHYFGNFSLSWKINDWLDVLGRAALDGTYDLQEERVAVGSVEAPSRYMKFNRSYSEANFDLIVNFNRKLSEDLSLRGLVGSNLRRNRLESTRSLTNGGLVVPEFYALTNSVYPIVAPVESYYRIGVDGIFANATLGYKELLFLDIAARRDQSTTLPQGHNTYYYPSVAGSFLFSNLFKEKPWLSYGKLRLNYAEVGNDAPALSISDYYDKPSAIGSVPSFSLPNTKNNPNLKPERTKSLEAGIEAAFVNSRFGFDFTWYKSNSIDQIMPVSVSATTGYLYQYVNAGEIQNKGIELSAYLTPVKTENFSWSLNVNYARNRNKVLSLYNENTTNLVIGDMSGGVTINATVGQPYGTIQGDDFIYTNGQRTVGDDGYYLLTDRVDNVIGNVNPDWTGGVLNTFKYKDVALNFLIDIRKGGQLFSLDQYYGQATGLYPITAGLNDLGNPKRNPISEGGGVILAGVKEDGSPNDIRVDMSPDYTYNPYGYTTSASKDFVYDASYVKLREVGLTYSLPQSVMNKIKTFKGIDVSLIGRNLWIIHKNVPYADPEDNLGSGNIQGYQGGAYPSVRTFGFNVRFRL